MSVRVPAVAGMFYPDNAQELRASIRDAYSHKLGPGNTTSHPSRCVICPHAGYYYSAHIACHSIRALAASKPSGPLILIGPEHASTQSGASITAAESWSTPLGDVIIDRKAADMMVGLSDEITVGDDAHDHEHSIEVQVPLLQDAFGDNLKIVPVSLSEQDAVTSASVGRAAAKVALELDGAIVASSDLTHYEPDSSARKKDGALIECVCSIDVDAMYDTLYKHRISACGYGAIAASMVAAIQMGAGVGTELAYATSGDVDDSSQSSVVGYASVVFA